MTRRGGRRSRRGLAGRRAHRGARRRVIARAALASGSLQEARREEAKHKRASKQDGWAAPAELLHVREDLLDVAVAEISGEVLHPVGGLRGELTELRLVLLAQLLARLAQGVRDAVQASRRALLLAGEISLDLIARLLREVARPVTQLLHHRLRRRA